MDSYYEDDKSKRPESSRNFPLVFPGPGEMRRASEMYYNPYKIWDVDYSDPRLERKQDSRFGEAYRAPDFQDPATRDFPAYGSASPWRNTIYPFARPMPTNTPPSPNSEYDSDDSISPKKPKVVLPPTQGQQRLMDQSLVDDQAREHPRLGSYLPQCQERVVSRPPGFPPGTSPQSQAANLFHPTPPVLHSRPWERTVSTPPGFSSQPQDRPDSCPPGFDPQSQVRSNIRPPPGFPPQNQNLSPAPFTPPPAQIDVKLVPSRRQFVTDRRQVVVTSPTFSALYTPIQARPNQQQHQRNAHLTPQQATISSPMGTSKLRQEERRSPVPPADRLERQRKLDAQAKGFDSDDDDAFYPHNH
ncbi:hypothetical protein F5Y13DRAFT_201413 [Hypoxylon sp. FL1857]|nr:hypothetical protein F5Y13DRAFT_201413 [Hypoxylon sp. FL1857]